MVEPEMHLAALPHLSHKTALPCASPALASLSSVIYVLK